jgi:DNA-binding NarL/FixJ family response regulator
MEDKKKILIVESNSAFRKALSILLSPKYFVSEALNAKGALAMMVSGYPFDLVIITREIPGGPLGEQLVREVKSRFPAMKVIFMADNPSPQIISVARAAGADGVIDKNFVYWQIEIETVIEEIFQLEASLN